MSWFELTWSVDDDFEDSTASSESSFSSSDSCLDSLHLGIIRTFFPVMSISIKL